MLTEVRQNLFRSPMLESTEKLTENITTNAAGSTQFVFDRDDIDWNEHLLFLGSVILPFIFMFYHKCARCRQYAPDHMHKLKAGTDIEQQATDT